jgi:hypothetical protein
MTYVNYCQTFSREVKMTTALVIVALLEALLIYGLVVSGRLRAMCRDILEAIKKAVKKQHKEKEGK